MHSPDTTPATGDRLAFFGQFLRHPLQIGSVIPSSPYLERRILAAAAIAPGDTVVELGPGTGGTTRAILGALPPDARLLSIEINPHFEALLRRIDDPRLVVHGGDARHLAAILAAHGLDAPGAVISGIPFSTMNNGDGGELIQAIDRVLAPGGRFVAYQVSDRVASLCRPVMGEPQALLEVRNIPPMRVYRWVKPAG